MNAPPRPTWTRLLLLGLALSTATCRLRDCCLAEIQSTPTMHPLVQDTKPLCFGRYLVDVPQKAETALGDSESDVVRIERVASPAPSLDAFRHKLEVREAELRQLTHRTEGARLHSAVDLTNNRGKLFLYREDDERTRMMVMEASVLESPTEWFLKYRTANKNVPEVRQEFEEVAAGLRPRPATEIPTTRGACVPDGLLDRRPTYGEAFAGGARLEELSWSLSVRSETSKPYKQSDQLLTRMADAIDMAGGASSGIKVLRRREVHLDGRAGQEHITIFPSDGSTSFDARLELCGDGTYRTPTLKLWMEANRLAPPDPSDPRPFLSDDEALALWDALLKSIRPRPGAF